MLKKRNSKTTKLCLWKKISPWAIKTECDQTVHDKSEIAEPKKQGLKVCPFCKNRINYLPL